MRIDPNDAAALRAVLLRDVEAVARIEEHIDSLPSRERSRTQLESLGFSLHNIYNALENSFSQISLTFENHVKDRERWHRELLDKMFLAVPPLRPAVLPETARPLLVDFALLSASLPSQLRADFGRSEADCVGCTLAAGTGGREAGVAGFRRCFDERLAR